MEVCLAVDRIEPYSERPGAEKRWRANQGAPRIKDNPLRAAKPPKAFFSPISPTEKEGLPQASSVFRIPSSRASHVFFHQMVVVEAKRGSA
jgi:hypothetical protein